MLKFALIIVAIAGTPYSDETKISATKIAEFGTKESCDSQADILRKNTSEGIVYVCGDVRQVQSATLSYGTLTR